MRIWLHAASVGEIEGARPLALGLRASCPARPLVVTTMTPAGRDAARTRIPGAHAYALAPLDYPSDGSALSAPRSNPDLVLIAETELWPELFRLRRARFGARIAIVNGRISTALVGPLPWVRPLFAEALGSVDLVLAQTKRTPRAIAALGAPRERVFVSGNAKFDRHRLAAVSRCGPSSRALRRASRMLVAGSTAPGEEAVVLDAYLSLLATFPDLALVLAPRHLDRVREVEAARRGVRIAVRQGERDSAAARRPCHVLILDTMGELRALYRRAAVAFVGGSIVAGRGGQSSAEPAAASVPVLIGPFHEAHEQLVAAMVAAGGARIVNDAGQIASACVALLADQAARVSAGRNAREALARLAGSVAPSLLRLKALASL